MNEATTAHSADVQMLLSVDGRVLKISHLAPDYLIVDQPIDHPPSEAEILLSVDGNESRWRVNLVEGLSASRARTRIRTSQL